MFEIVFRFKSISHKKNKKYILLTVFYELIYNTEIRILQKGKRFTLKNDHMFKRKCFLSFMKVKHFFFNSEEHFNPAVLSLTPVN